MAMVASEHVRKHYTSDEHRCYGVDVHCPDDFFRSLFVESLVACDDAGAVDQDIDVSAFFYGLAVGDCDDVVI